MLKPGFGRTHISNLKPNPDNPRTIRQRDFKRLVQSLQAFPEMLEARPVVCTPDGVVLGGNMRLSAMREAGISETPVHVVEWPENKQREFIIKDNVSFGDWDWDTLANEWDELALIDWGLDVPIDEPKEPTEDDKPKCELCGK